MFNPWPFHNIFPNMASSFFAVLDHCSHLQIKNKKQNKNMCSVALVSSSHAIG